MADRTFEVNITTAVQAPCAIKNAGYAGEHNATAIKINLPAEYIGGFTYSLDLMTGAGEAYPYPLVLGDGDDFLVFELAHALTDKGALDFQLKITETATSMVVKARVINLQFIGRDISVYAELAEGYIPETTATEDCLNAVALVNAKIEELNNTHTPTSVMPEDYGAVGDGVTDDTVAVQAAISQAEETGLSVLFSPGKVYGVSVPTPKVAPAAYVTPSALLIDFDNCTLDLNGATIRMLPNDVPECDLIKVYDCSGCVIKNGTLQGDRLTHTHSQVWGGRNHHSNCYCVRVYKAYVVLEDLDIYDSTGDGVLCEDGQVTNLIHSGTSASGSTTTLTKVGENFLTNTEVGDIIWLTGGAVGYVSEVVSNTALAIAGGFTDGVSASGKAYRIFKTALRNLTGFGSLSIRNCEIHHCRRNGIAIMNFDRVEVHDTYVHHIGTYDEVDGYSPFSGIDIEPGENSTTNYVELVNVRVSDTEKHSILHDSTSKLSYVNEVRISNVQTTAAVQLVGITYCTITSSKFFHEISEDTSAFYLNVNLCRDTTFKFRKTDNLVYLNGEFIACDIEGASATAYDSTSVSAASGTAFIACSFLNVMGYVSGTSNIRGFSYPYTGTSNPTFRACRFNVCSFTFQKTDTVISADNKFVSCNMYIDSNLPTIYSVTFDRCSFFECVTSSNGQGGGVVKMYNCYYATTAGTSLFGVAKKFIYQSYVELADVSSANNWRLLAIGSSYNSHFKIIASIPGYTYLPRANSCIFELNAADSALVPGEDQINCTVITDGAHVLSPGCAEMYMYGNTTACVIDVANVYHAIYNSFGNHDGTLAPVVDTKSFTYKAGVGYAIASIANYNSPTNTKIRCTVTGGHALLAGEPVTITGTTDYDGTYVVLAEGLTATQFVVTKTYVSSQTGSVRRPATLKALVGGTYKAGFTFSGNVETPNDNIKIELNKDAVALDNIGAIGIWSTTTKYETLSASGLVLLAAGQYVWASVKNYSGTGDITFYSANVTLTRLT